MEKTQLLNRFARDKEERIELAYALDQLEAAQRRSIPMATKFLTPAQQASLKDVLAVCGHPRHVFFGGFEGAERAVCGFLPDWQEEGDWLEDEKNPVCAIRCRFQEGSGLTHRDFLGGLMGIGIVRPCIGDILVQDGTCDVLTLRESAPIIMDQFTSAGRYRVETAMVSLNKVESLPQKVKEIRDTVAALRLDAVLAAGFSISRGKAADLVNGGRVSVNHRECIKTDRQVAEGDILTCKGLGKCVLKEVHGVSKKGRTIIMLQRYL